MVENQDELIQFVDDSEHDNQTQPDTFWSILLVDDEPDVHAATCLALKNLTVAGRPLHFLHAYSAKEAKQVLVDNNNIAVAIVDVVMETDEAGLELVRHIRHDLKNINLRIILRTGQPGYAPEISTIKKYDINDYRTKTELTQTRLYTSLTIAIRSYSQIKQIESLAYQDALVNLPNRNAMLMELSKNQQSGYTIALIDLDNFSDINNIIDDSFGDAVLMSVANHLRKSFSNYTFIARLGSDLFGLYGPNDEVNPDNILAQFAEPFIINNIEQLRLSATAGLFKLTSQLSAPAELLKNAGAALKQAKRLVRGKAIYFQIEQSYAARDRIKMLNMLRSSLSEQHLELYFQPFIRLNDLKVIGAECLLRWQTPDGKFISPDVFIPIAEQSGLMIAIGEWVVRSALSWRQRMKKYVDDSFKVAINISQMQFNEPNFVDGFFKLLKESGINGNQVELELTESIAIENIEALDQNLEQLQASGVHISMDDFGTGYSSLSVLQNLKLNRLKIDRSFISGPMANGNFDMAKTIITMAEHLNLNTIAEGIETAEQCQALQAVGCQDGQGYFFSKPLPEDQFIQWLREFNQ